MSKHELDMQALLVLQCFTLRGLGAEESVQVEAFEPPVFQAGDPSLRRQFSVLPHC